MDYSQKASPPYVVVRESPLFLLPPEIRNEIYMLLLTHPDPICLYAPLFKRNRNGKGCYQTNNPHDPEPLQPCQPIFTPTIFPAILRVCHSINQEASKIVYYRNNFQFLDPAALFQFRCTINSPNAAALKEIRIEIYPTAVEQWRTLLNGDTFDVMALFPQLKRLVVKLCLAFYDVFDPYVSLSSSATKSARSICLLLAKNFRDLDWVHVTGVQHSEEFFDAKKAMLERQNVPGY